MQKMQSAMGIVIDAFLNKLCLLKSVHNGSQYAVRGQFLLNITDLSLLFLVVYRRLIVQELV